MSLEPGTTLSEDLIEKIHNHCDHFGAHNLKVLVNRFREDFKEKFPEVAEHPELFTFYTADFIQAFGLNALDQAFVNLTKLDAAGYVDKEGRESKPIEAGLEVFKKFYTKTITEFTPSGSEAIN